MKKRMKKDATITEQEARALRLSGFLAGVHHVRFCLLERPNFTHEQTLALLREMVEMIDDLYVERVVRDAVEFLKAKGVLVDGR